MTNEAMRVAIAEYLGWHTIQQNPMYQNDKTKLAGFQKGDHTALCGIPNYHGSLDAMHEAERLLLEMDKSPKSYKNGCIWIPTAEYGGHLMKITGLSNPFHATASQRCEAFLKTVGLWRDS